MNYRILNIALAIILFLAAYYTFDLHDPMQFAITSVLVLSGVHSLFMDSESPARRRFARSCMRLAAVIAVFLIAKLLILG